MITVAKMIEELQKYPPNALCYAYEGEICGVVIVEPHKRSFPGGGVGRHELGHIIAREGDAE